MKPLIEHIIVLAIWDTNTFANKDGLNQTQLVREQEGGGGVGVCGGGGGWRKEGSREGLEWT